MDTIKVMIRPDPGKPGQGEGGIKRVVEAQYAHLPALGFELVDDVSMADLVCVHATTWVPGTGNRPVVTHCHGLYWDEYTWPRWAHEANKEVIDCIRKADAVTAPTQWVANSIRRGTQCPVTVLPNGIDLDQWRVPDNWQHKGYILWNKTRPDPICDPRPVEVLATMLPSREFVTTVFLGDPNTHNVTVVGVQPHDQHTQLVKDAGLYLCTARETFGIGTLEALAAGVPIVGWNWGGQREFITPETGVLVKPGDYAALAKGIEYAFAHRDEMSRACVELAEQYAWPKVMQKYANLYRTVVRWQPTKRVSVVIPSYNLGKYLPEAIKSVKQQLGPDDELIIVDDCSTDGSREIAYEHVEVTSPPVRVAHTPSNLYLAGALNYGIGKAQGRYILNLDADNVLPANTLDILAGELDADRGLDIAYGKIKFVTESGEPDKRVSGDGVSGWPPAQFNYNAQMIHKNQIPSGAMFRRKIWERVGGYRRRCRTAEDADFWCRATSAGARAHRVTDAVTLVYRNRADSMSNTEVDWPWELWYAWGKPPYAAPVQPISVPTYEPVAVSIVVPVGPGHEETLLDTLDSVYMQSLTGWEVIVVDDSHKLRWLPSWVRYARTDAPGSGVSVARNLGIDRVRGHTFVLLDADDYLTKDALEKMYTAWVQCDDPAHTYVYTNFYNQEEFREVKIEPFDFADMARMLKHPVTCLYPTQVRDTAKFDPTFTYGEDWDYILGLLHGGYCGLHLQEPLMYYRTQSGKNRQMLLDNGTEVRQKVTAKWGTSMGDCGCRGKAVGGCVGPDCGPQPSVAGMSQATSEAMMRGNALPQLNAKDLVLVEFTRPDTPPLRYTGAVTGKAYRFGSTEGDRIQYVHKDDAARFVARPEFEYADPSMAQPGH